ncbi:MAG: YraN family protein [Acidiferrobacterales bacterium]
MPTHLQRGQIAEDKALAYLESHGLNLHRRNYRTPYGEIDLIMVDPGLRELVFVEVRYRKNERFGGAAQSVDRHKQNKLVASAEHFRQHYTQYIDSPCRFDVVTLSGDMEKGSLQWYRNAF